MGKLKIKETKKKLLNIYLKLHEKLQIAEKLFPITPEELKKNIYICGRGSTSDRSIAALVFSFIRSSDIKK